MAGGPAHYCGELPCADDTTPSLSPISRMTKAFGHSYRFRNSRLAIHERGQVVDDLMNKLMRVPITPLDDRLVTRPLPQRDDADEGARSPA